MHRRDFLTRASALLTAGALAGCRRDDDGAEPAPEPPDPSTDAPASRNGGPAARARRLTRQDPDVVHMAGLLIATHPDPVAQAIAEHRDGLDRNPAGYVNGTNREADQAVRRAAARYLGGAPEQYALTDSTTMGIGLVYGGLKVGPGDELLTTDHDYYSTHEALKLRAARSGATVRRVPHYADLSRVSAGELVDGLRREIRPATRVLALTWVQSDTGLKLPIREITEALRSSGGAPIIALDAVHAVGVEDFDVTDLGVDFLMAGTHKWLLGPRGTGILWGHPRAHGQLEPIIPTFTFWDGWGGRMTPGGFHAFEHRWALAQAFDLQRELGKADVAAHIRSLATQLKEGLSKMGHVRLHTPMNPRLSAGIVCFDVDGLSADATVARLRERNVIASTTPYLRSHARLTPGVLNTPADVDFALAALRALA